MKTIFQWDPSVGVTKHYQRHTHTAVWNFFPHSLTSLAPFLHHDNGTFPHTPMKTWWKRWDLSASSGETIEWKDKTIQIGREKWDIYHQQMQKGKKNLTLTNLKTWRQVWKGNRVELESGKRRGNVMMERTRERVLKKSGLKNNNHVMAWLVSPYLSQWTGKWEEDREKWWKTDGKEKETKVSEWAHLN